MHSTMKTITPGMLRQAAAIMEYNHPWERYSKAQGRWLRGDCGLATAYKYGDEIRLALVAPPIGELLHNPAKLNADQVGCGYRLLTLFEAQGARDAAADWWTGTDWLTSTVNSGYSESDTYRVPLSTPWPVKADPLAKLKAAHAAGKRIQFSVKGAGEWTTTGYPRWDPGYDWREVPESESEFVDLETADILPGSVLRHPTWDASEWSDVGRVTRHKVYTAGIHSIRHLRTEGWLINQSIPRTGKWDPTAWELCHKQKV